MKKKKLCEPVRFSWRRKLPKKRVRVTHIPATFPRDEGLSGQEIMYKWQEK